LNWHHLKAIIWLNWRLSVNQWKKGGVLNLILGALIVGMAVVASSISFLVALLVGIFAMRGLNAEQWMLVWDGLIVGFLLFWLIGLLTELQRSEILSLDKLMHLPLSLFGAFLLNYLSSLLSLSLLIFLPLSFGLALALIVVQGWHMLVALPLLVAFFLMVTALTNQFRGWLHMLMLNKRRRRTIVAIVTVGFIFVVQLPNVLNMTVFRQHRGKEDQEQAASLAALNDRRVQGEITSEQFEKLQQELTVAQREKHRQTRNHQYRQVVDWATLANAVVPVGWLPYGIWRAAQGSVWAGLCGTLGAFGIGALSLRRSYRTTLNVYQGKHSARKPAKPKLSPPASVSPGVPTAVRRNFLEKDLPGVPGSAAAVALASFRSLLRGPEGKTLLATPFILMLVFGSMLLFGREKEVPELMRPLLALASVSVSLLCFVQLMANTFGYDRVGFKAFLLSPCDRSRILLGKNLSVAPMAMGIPALATIFVQIFFPLHITHLLATYVQIVNTFLLSCLIGNLASSLAPFAIAPGSTKPAHMKVATILIHVIIASSSPATLLPGLMAYGLEMLVTQVSALSFVPVYLIGSLLELALVVWLYRRLLPAQGRLLQRREIRILEVVSARTQ